MPIPTIKQTEQKYLVSYMFFSKLRQEVRTKMTHAKLCFYVKQPIEFEFFTRKLAVDFLRNRWVERDSPLSFVDLNLHW